MNKTAANPVFMVEGRQVVAGEAILIGATTDLKVGRPDEVVESLVRDHSRLVYRIVYAVLRSHHDAEDATQETFMRVLRHGSKLSDIEEPKAWLARIAWRVAVDRTRQRRHAREISLDVPERAFAEPVSTAAGADENLQTTQIGARLENLIEALPEKLRQPLVLSAIEDMTPREVAAMLGINEAAVRSRIFRARQILKEKLAAFEKRP
jgi:RNA polymerase sigma-70 factor (ECF subfamily)